MEAVGRAGHRGMRGPLAPVPSPRSRPRHRHRGAGVVGSSL